MSKFWRKMIFWENMKKTIAVFGAPSVTGLHMVDASNYWVMTAGILSLFGAGLSIWMTDYNKNGLVDIFEDEQGK